MNRQRLVVLTLVCVSLGSSTVAGASPPSFTLGARAQFKSDGRENPLTNELVYLPLSIEGGLELRPWLGLHASAGFGAVRGNETRGDTIELMVGASVRHRRGRLVIGARLDAGYSATYINFKGEEGWTRGSLVEPSLQLGREIGAHGALSLLAGPRVHVLHWIRTDGTGPDGRRETRWNTGFGLGVAYEHRF